MISLNWPWFGQQWTQTADGRIRCAVCDEPSEQAVFRSLTVENEQGHVTGVLRRPGALCPACAALEAREKP